MTTTSEEGALRRATARLGAVRARVRGLPGGRLVWRVAVTLLGVAVVVVGIVLLPLPGPGWLIIFTGLGILATEFTWAAELLARSRRFVGAWTRWTMRQGLVVRFAVGLGGLLIVVGALALSWYLYRLAS